MLLLLLREAPLFAELLREEVPFAELLREVLPVRLRVEVLLLREVPLLVEALREVVPLLREVVPFAALLREAPLFVDAPRVEVVRELDAALLPRDDAPVLRVELVFLELLDELDFPLDLRTAMHPPFRSCAWCPSCERRNDEHKT